MKTILVTGRTIAQGQSKEIGKFSEKYMESVAVCEIDEKDMGTLGLEPGQNVKVKSNFGAVVLKAVKAKEPSPGMVFVPCGPWANLLIGSKSDGTGMPLFKSIEAEVEPAPSEKVLNLRELIKKAYGGK